MDYRFHRLGGNGLLKKLFSGSMFLFLFVGYSVF